MNKKEKISFGELRRRAEEILGERKSGGPRDPDLLRLIQELEFHHVELELQNEELKGTQKELEASRNQYQELYDSLPVGLVTVNGRGLVIKFNRRAEELLAGPGRYLSQRAFSSLIHPQDHDQYFSCLKETVDLGGRHACVVRLAGREESLVYARIETGAYLDESGKLTEWRLAVTDISEQKRAEIALQALYEDLEKRVAERTEALRRSEQNIEVELQAARHLQQLSTQLIQADHIEALYEKVLDTAKAILKADFATIQMLYPERGTVGELRLLGYRGITAKAAEFWEWVGPASRSSSGAALRTGQRVVIPDVRLCDYLAGSDDLDNYLQTDIRAVQTTPLFSRSGKLLGMLSTHWREPHEPTAGELRSLDVLARQAADLIERSQADEALKKAHDELEQRVQVRTAEIKERAEQLARLSSQLTLTEQRERRRLAVIIHDHLQQLLVGAKIRLELMSKRLNTDDRKEFEQIYNLLVESLRTARTLNTQLSPSILYERGLAAALERLARSMQETYELSIETSIDAPAAPEREEVKILLFESVRELLFNIVKHARTSSGRLVMAPCGPRGVQISVSDQGVGFDPEKLTRELGQDDRFGLFSIRERLELIGGSLEIESSPGKGSTFTLIAPLGEIVTESKQKDITGDGPFFKESVRRGDEAGDKICIMLVDDHAVMRKGLSSMLDEHSDIKVVGEAADGEEAVQMARDLQPDVILMDISMPKMNGIEATRVIHSDFPRIRIIGLSMYDDVETSRAMLAAGASAFMTKSSSSDALMAAIRMESRT